jgi:Uma2 family endonuclease
MSSAPPPTLAAEDLYGLPPDDQRYELVAGTLVCEPPPGAEHGRVEAILVTRLTQFVLAEGRGVVYAGDAGFILARSPDTVRAPDIAFVESERARRCGRRASYFPGPPDLAVEILSPSDRPGDVHAKVADLLGAGTRIVWVVDPATQTIRVYRALLAPRRLCGTDDLDGEDVLPGFRLRVAELFEG